jgi:hypothetical protein
MEGREVVKNGRDERGTDQSSDGQLHRRADFQLVAIAALLGIGASVAYATQARTVPEGVTVLAVAVMISGASMLSGGFVGFLFGIPRSLQPGGGPASDSSGASTVSEASGEHLGYRANTNLEEISDWLTKILVGVGLTQVTALPEAVEAYAEMAAVGLGEFPTSGVYSVALLIYYLAIGFLVGYLTTRVHLPGLLREADTRALGGRIERVDRRLSALEDQIELDNHAHTLMLRQLNPSPSDAPIAQDALNDAIGKASYAERREIFYEAYRLRHETWSDTETVPVMERTIPIFRALIYSDRNEVFHRNHSELGYALKDKREPDWAGALRELSKAIEIRGPWQEYGWMLYEFNRAVCRIAMDESFQNNRPSNGSVKTAILDDLAAAAHHEVLLSRMRGVTSIRDWLRLNGVDSVESLLEDQKS